MASAFSVLNAVNESFAAPKISSQPPSSVGRFLDRHEDHDVDQGVLHERDQRGRPQARGVGVGREHGERDEQRQVADEPVGVVGAEAHHLEDHLDADQLERDVRHRGEDAGERHDERERPAVVAALHEVRRRDVAVPVGHRPQPGQEQEDQWVDDDRVRHREESDRASGVQQRGHRDKRVRRVEVAADQEPRNEGAEAAAAESPLVEAVEGLRAAPAGGHEAEHGDEQEEEQEDAESNGADVTHRGAPSRAARSRRSAPLAR